MNIYLISDSLTQTSLQKEDISLSSSWFSLRKNNGSVLLVESAWNGRKNRWKFKIASYPDHPKRSNEKLVRLVQTAKDKGISTVFWNKEDSVHFDRFIDSAKHFDHIFTVDENCVERYREVVPASTTVDVAMFPVQPRIHNYQGFNFRQVEANFVGSFSRHIHNKRRERQEMLFSAALKAGLPVTVFDRNSNRKSRNYRYPEQEFGLKIMPALDYAQTADIYRRFAVSLNVNTIEDSPTMFSRRVVEILACGGILVSTPGIAMDRLFKDYCHIVNHEDEAAALFERLKHGPSEHDLEMAKAGADFVLNHFTWRKFLEKIQSVIHSTK
ncbi:CgeB family protein [Neisseria musculi]|uniref:Glycosyl transferases group 1 family protein n=1 Tax=Neisseria musculi TaxID=1815583 RepID=A0A7H1MAT7_9NEIS|nr:glycosyltransferase [Neisseria musculi]QNT58752.1 glycosyl transferases group 1 family protein [Neisseria musculi]